MLRAGELSMACLDLGMDNVFLDNNIVEDQIGFQTHLDVQAAIPNVTCINTTFQEHGKIIMRAKGC